MNLIKGLFSSRLFPTDEELLSNLFKILDINSSKALPPNYQELVQAIQKKAEDRSQFFKHLVKKSIQIQSTEGCLKIMTIVMHLVRKNNYDEEYVESLEQYSEFSSRKNEKQIWFNELSIALISYLMKMPSIRDVYARAIKYMTQPQTSYKLEDLYRVINQVGLLFPHLINSINSIGRYFMTTTPYFPEFYKILRSELILLYSYLKYILQNTILNYKTYSKTQILCFMNTLPEIELTCDKLEDFIMNKYFKGKGMGKKIGLKEEEIGEINYYLKMEGKSERKKELVSTTARSTVSETNAQNIETEQFTHEEQHQ